MENNLIVCCEQIMKRVEIGIIAEQLTEKLEPFKLWSADLFKCTKCGHEIIAGFGTTPIAYCDDEEYEKAKKLYKGFKRIIYRFTI